MAWFLATGTRSGPRPFVPLELNYRCPRCRGERHVTIATALVDSGATRGSLPAEALPDHVAWDDLIPVQQTYGGAFRTGVAVRLWHTDLRVLGARIATEVLVIEPGAGLFPYAVLGTGDLFERFAVSFAFQNVPPVFALEPLGQLVTVSGAVGELPELPDVLWDHFLPDPLDGPADRPALVESVATGP